MSRKFAPVLCALVLSLAVPAEAAPAEAEAAFAQGAELFRTEDYAAAIQYFRQARDAGLSGPAVHYNIGVCAYRLGEYAEASAAFEAVTTYYEMAPLAYYNLGLVELERGRSSQAKQWFQRARVTTDDPQLQAMADRMLRPASGASLPSRWYGILLAEAGYDDNVRLLNDDVPLPGESLDSPVGILFGSITGPYTGAEGFLLDASAYVSQNFDADDIDQFEVLAGGRYQRPLLGWRAEVGAQYGYSTLGGDEFENKWILSAKARRRLSERGSVDIRYAYEDISSGDDMFEFIDGNRQRVRLRYIWQGDANTLEVSYDAELNDRDDPRVSPDRHRGKSLLRMPLADLWTAELQASWRRSKYDDIVAERTENLWMAGLRVTRKLNDSWDLYADYQIGDNDASDDRFSYTRHRAVIGASWLF